MQAELDAAAAQLGAKPTRLKDKRRRRMSLGAVVAMEQHKYTEDGVDTFDCAMEEFMQQTNLDVRRLPPCGTAVSAAVCVGSCRC